MEDFSKRIAFAKTDDEELERLIGEYLPFIKKEIAKTNVGGLEYDDKVSLGMLVFMNCVRQYKEERGGFLSFAAVSIRNRLIDAARKAGREAGQTLSFTLEEEQTPAANAEQKASVQQYCKEREQQALQEEIETLAAVLQVYGLSFAKLAAIGPKQKRSRLLCARLANGVVRDEGRMADFIKTGRLPQRALAGQFNIAEKTIEKHRKFIVALVVILSGDYPGIRGYIPGSREVNG